MTEPKTLTTAYVAGEGREHLDACMAVTFNYCRDHEIDVIVIYTSTGEGPCLAVERYLSIPEFSSIRLVAVTPPASRPYVANPQQDPEKREIVLAGVIGERRKLLMDANVMIVSARLPFRSLSSSDNQSKRPSNGLDPMQMVDRAYGVLGGGFSFCVQVALMACDAGGVRAGERVAVMSADTSMVVLASQSESFLDPVIGLLVEHIICRPLHYNISKSGHFATSRAATSSLEDKKQLPLHLDSQNSNLVSEEADGV